MQTADKHTPGEWKVHSHAPFSVWCGDTQIASCRWMVEVSPLRPDPNCEQNFDRATANARLCGAAPEMYAALKAVKHGAEYPDELGDIIDAALSKIEG